MQRELSGSPCTVQLYLTGCFTAHLVSKEELTAARIATMDH